MASPHLRNPRGHTIFVRRRNHNFNEPTTGRIFTAIFVQPLTAECRTVEVIRYRGADCWKARIQETRSVLSRLGQQVEYAGDSAACSDVTDFFKRQGMRLIRQWEAIYPDWPAVAVSPAARPTQLRGDNIQ